MAGLNQSYTEKLNLMKKSDYQSQLLEIVEKYSQKLTVKQLRQLIAKYALS